MRVIRLRQAVVAAADRDAVVATWTHELRTGTPFHDPGVVEFGLCNAVVPIGDTFLEVVSPIEGRDDTAAGRYMSRHGGDCGYMAIFQVDDIEAARSHLADLGVRTVWNADLDDISGTHLHPADVGAAIVSFDQATPPSSWRWAGPRWPDQVRTDVVTGLAGIVLAADDPSALLARWSEVLDIEPSADRLVLPDGSYVGVGDKTADGRIGLVGIDLWSSGGAVRSFRSAGVDFRVG